MPFTIATRPGQADQENEDFAAATERTAVVLDGVSGRPGDGCVHGVAWYTRRLGALLLAEADAGAPLRTALAGAIREASSLHAHTCDLTRQESPSATVVVARVAGEELEYLVLSDSLLAVAGPEGTRLFTETRLEELRAEIVHAPYTSRAHTPEREAERRQRRRDLRSRRNVEGGFWTAGADPRAAEAALVGAVPLAGVRGWVAMTDGASRAVDVFGAHHWTSAVELVLDRGPLALIEEVRSWENADPEGARHPRGKVHDDATVLSWSPEPEFRS